jgi:HEAT repeat protein
MSGGAEAAEEGPPSEIELDSEREQIAAELSRALGELERCADLGSYKQAGMRVERAADVLVRAKSFALAYTAVQTLARHAQEPDRDARQRAEAADRLGRALRSEEMLTFVIEQACSTGLGSVQAAQILVEVGAMGVPRLLERVASASGEVRQQAAAVLVAMAEHAFPLLVEELTSGDPVRVKRAARLLGEMQHPRGVEFVVAHLTYPDGLVQKEVARALVRIGTDQAIGALVAALDGEDATAEIAAAALGGSESRLALAALLRVSDPRAPHAALVRREAIRGLGRLQRPEAVPVLSAVLRRRAIFGRKRNRLLRVVAAQALGRIGGAEASALLHSLCQGGDPVVRQACLDSLRVRSRTGAE